jgi:hypothetical protein
MDTNTNIKLDVYTAVGLAEGFIESNSEEEVIAAWQYIYDNDLWQGLQGWFGRTVNDLLKQGIIKPKS